METKEVDRLKAEDVGREDAELDEHDCHAGPESGCEVCLSTFGEREDEDAEPVESASNLNAAL